MILSLKNNLADI